MAWSLVQSRTEGTQGADPRTLAFSSNVTAGNLLVFCEQFGSGSGASTFSKSSGTATIGTVTTVKTVNDTTDVQSMSVGWCLVTGSGSLTIQGTAGAGAFCELSIHEFSGSDSSTTTDGSNGAAPSSSNPSSGSFTTTVNGDLIFEAGVDSSGTGNLDKGSSFTAGVDGGGSNLNVSGWKVQTSAGSINPDMVNSVTEVAIVIGVAFTPAPAGPTITVQPQNVMVPLGPVAAIFSVTATASAGALHYQWKKNGSNVGSDSSTYSIVPDDLALDGSTIKCDVSDDNGTTTTSPDVFLNVFIPLRAFDIPKQQRH